MEKPEEVPAFRSPWQEGNFSTKSETELEPRIEDLATRFAGRITRDAMKAAFTGGASIEARAERAVEKNTTECLAAGTELRAATFSF
ncbi:hypothetical protein [Microbulbifer elongatus]|uniref:hypothetical protein n=1 Tax=Microbulbifer elongatus TaxID=86173 RepID=UPI001E2C6484|nr:hypothetical protein [Microbulbifer elongatus]